MSELRFKLDDFKAPPLSTTWDCCDWGDEFFGKIAEMANLRLAEMLAEATEVFVRRRIHGQVDIGEDFVGDVADTRICRAKLVQIEELKNGT